MKSWPLAPLLIFVGITGGGLLAPEAHADGVSTYTTWKADSICDWMSRNPTPAAVPVIFHAIQYDSGFSNDDTARVLVGAVATTCPESMVVLQRFVDLNTPDAPAFKTGAMGGRLG